VTIHHLLQRPTPNNPRDLDPEYLVANELRHSVHTTLTSRVHAGVHRTEKLAAKVETKEVEMPPL